MAQVEAGENAVVERLRKKGLYPDPAQVFQRIEQSNERHTLEHSLATGFIKLQKERDPAARQAQWVDLQRLASEIERLNERQLLNTYYRA